jgi:hypothetical protein
MLVSVSAVGGHPIIGSKQYPDYPPSLSPACNKSPQIYLDVKKAVNVMFLYVLRISLDFVGLFVGGRYWDRTSGFHRVKVALYR